VVTSAAYHCVMYRALSCYSTRKHWCSLSKFQTVEARAELVVFQYILSFLWALLLAWSEIFICQRPASVGSVIGNLLPTRDKKISVKNMTTNY